MSVPDVSQLVHRTAQSRARHVSPVIQIRVGPDRGALFNERGAGMGHFRRRRRSADCAATTLDGPAFRRRCPTPITISV